MGRLVLYLQYVTFRVENIAVRLSFDRSHGHRLFRSIGVLCLYINDRHNRQLQVPLDKGEYSLLKTHDARDNAAASSAIFLVAFHLVRLGYFLGLLKSILTPSKIVPYLGFLTDSSREVFHLIPEKKVKFITFVRDILGNSYVTIKTLQRLDGK